ncbi:putative transcriptional regulator [Nocardia nova SH22a]|uniref:Putative transcriptional regulator n=1 Tax=Nocardia nova SH22a TaxID=1415166 RepID=W5TQ63_9NOCA|nr:helix-turn-helix domain-containing protein [Nocardia nova]AHH21377.1 putative transcriptional regulator [Nocardia nova SH22a]
MFAESVVAGPLLRELRTAAGIGLRVMATRTAFAAGYLSEVETGRKPVTDAVVCAYRKVLGDPTLGMPDVDVDRLAATVADPSGAGASSLEDITVILERSRRLEYSAGPGLVAPVARGLDGLARVLAAEHVAGTSGAALASEVARFRGWLELALGRPHSGDKALADSAELAEEAGDPSQLQHAMSFRAYGLREQGDLRSAIALTEEALKVPGTHPMLRVYDSYQLAKFHVARGEASAALRQLRRADRAAEATDELEPPSYGYWYSTGFWALQRGRVLWMAGAHDRGRQEVIDGLAALPGADRESTWAAKWRAAADGGDMPA